MFALRKGNKGDSMKKCCFVIPYFGSLPNYIELFFKTCEYNKDFNWLFITDQEIDFKLIDDPINEFKKLHVTSKNKKGELSNFNYLLLINKYSSRTYNDYNQYLVFPLLFMDEENKRKRDLSKVIALNKENNQNSIDKALNNYISF